MASHLSRRQIAPAQSDGRNPTKPATRGRERGAGFHAGQNRTLELLAAGASLEDVLSELVRAIEVQSSGMVCSILLFDATSGCLRDGAAPNLPEEYTKAIDGIAIGPSVGSCGTAAYRRERVIVEDIATDPLWEKYRDLALKHDLRSCWSQPVLTPTGQLLGTFAMYYEEPRGPDAFELDLIEKAANLAAIAIERKRAEQAVLESEERYRIVAQSARDAIVTIDRESRILFANPATEKIFGYTAAELRNTSLTMLMPELFRASHCASLKQYLDTGKRRLDWEGVEFSGLHKSGRVLTLEVSFGEQLQGGQHLFTGVIRDVTARKRAEEETLARLERARQQQAAIVELATHESAVAGDLRAAARLITEAAAAAMDVERAGVWLFSGDRRKLHCIDLFERTPQTHTGGLVLHAANYPEYFGALESGRAVEAHDARTDPRTSGFAEGYLVPLGITSMLDAAVRVSGRTVGVVCHEHVGKARRWLSEEAAIAGEMADQVAQVLMNRERRRAMKALEKQRAFLRQVIDINPTLIFAKDRQGRFTLVNQALANVYGTTVEELVGKTDADFNTNEAEVEFFRRMDLEVMDSLQEKLIPEEVITDAKGELRWLQTVKRPLADDGGKANLVLGVATDITERKLAEKERQRLGNQLRQAQKMEAIGTLAAGVAHDFNNVLTAIMACSEQVRRAVGDERTALDALERIDETAAKAGGVVRSLLTFSRKAASNKRPIHLSRMATESVGLLRHMLPSTIEIATEMSSGDDVWIEADAAQLQQVVMNLAINARDAMPNGGTLRISVEHQTAESEDVVSAGAAPGTGNAVLAVEDSGVGMSEEVRARILEPFFTTKPRGQGTGLGMAVVHGIVTDHGGSMQIESQEGHGTRINVGFPCCDPPTEPLDQAQEDHVGLGHGETVILVEDSRDILTAMTLLLQSEGYEVLEAADGVEAMQVFHTHQARVSLVVLDLNLPRKSGLTCLEEMRRRRPDMPVIMATAADQRIDDKIDSHTRVLRKPFRPAELVKMVSEVLTGGAQPAIGR